MISVLSPVQPSSPQGCVFLQRCIRSTNKVCLEERGRKRSRSQTLSEESTLAPQSFSSTRIKQKEDKLSRRHIYSAGGGPVPNTDPEQRVKTWKHTGNLSASSQYLPHGGNTCHSQSSISNTGV